MPDTTPTLADMVRRALVRDAQQPAIEYDGQWHSWGMLRLQAERLTQLLNETGISDSAPVAFIPRNRPSSVAALLALLAKGRTVQMVYAFQSAHAIAADIARLRPSAVLLDAQDVAPPIVDLLISHGIAGIALHDDSVAVIAGAERASPNVSHQTGPDEPLIEILTSGTTGPPKQFPIRHSMIAHNLIGATAMATDAQTAASVLPPYLLYFPLGNISGIYSTIPTLVRGQRACLLDRFSLSEWRDYVVRHRPAHSGIPPSMMRALLDADIPVAELRSLKAMGVGAAPLDPELQRAFEDRYAIPILQSYGATEFGGPVCAWSVDLHAQWGRTKLGSVGQPIMGAQLRIVDAETGLAVSAGTQGLLEVLSPRIGPAWIRTADIGHIDEDGFLFLGGRADGAIMRGGFKILPETIERALLLHDAVAEAAVVDVADKRLGQVPGAAIVCTTDSTGISAEILAAHLRTQLPATHIPVHWHICNALPFNASMKIDRPAIRNIFKDLADN